MTWQKTPWAVGGGAKHDVETLRLVSYAAMRGGAEGIIGPGDLKVQAEVVNGPTVRIAPGGASLLNRSPGAGRETYIGANPTEDHVAIPPSPSTGPRTHMVVVRVEDPQYTPWPVPEDPETAQYIFTRVITDVSALAETAEDLNLGYPAIALARVVVPANGVNITPAMITDLRRLALPREKRQVIGYQPTANQALPAGGADTRWPNYAPPVRVPDWATHVRITVHASGVWQGAGGNHLGHIRIAYGGQLSPVSQLEMESSTNNTQHVILGSAEFDCVADRGNLVNVALFGAWSSGLSTRSLEMRTTSQVLYDVQFEERTV